jgi:exosortase A-associated hydrolase 1
VIVVGGPQYRVGSHRQFLLLARALAESGAAVLRFDCRGMGDSGGHFPGFERIEPDIAAAVAALSARCPTIDRLYLWGLCDATLAICAHAGRSARIAGVALVNPWVRTVSGHARVQLKHYYLARLGKREFLLKVLKGRFDPIASAWSFARNMFRAASTSASVASAVGGEAPSNPLAEQMAADLLRFNGRVLVVLSGKDLTAKEFAAAARASSKWRGIYASKSARVQEFANADHTFSSGALRDELAALTVQWIAAQATAPDQPRTL